MEEEAAVYQGSILLCKVVSAPELELPVSTERVEEVLGHTCSIGTRVSALAV